MKSFIGAVAATVVLLPALAAAQSALGYDISLNERIDGAQMSSKGHILVSGSSVRMDLTGTSTTSRVAGRDFGDSLTVISTDTGNAQLLSIIGHRKSEYVQFAPALVMAKMKSAMQPLPRGARLDFSGSTVKLDSIPLSDSLAGYLPFLFRLDIKVRFSLNGMPMGEQTALIDYYVVPELKEFARATAMLTQGMGNGATVPGIELPRDFTDQLAAATRRIESQLAIKTVIDVRSNLFGTGTMRTQTIEASNIRRTDAQAGSFIVPTGYKRIIPAGMEKFM